MKFSIITFGCKVNAYESQSLKERLLSLGNKEVCENKEADYYFINTCAVTHTAEKKCLQKTRAICKNHPNSKIVIMGCSSQINKDKYLQIKNVYKVYGNVNKDCVEKCIDTNKLEKDLVIKENRHLNYEETPTYFSERNVRGYVKIQDGCNNFCTYCIVPYTRGNSRCRDHNLILEEIHSLLKNGVREIVLGGIDTGCYKDPFDSSYNLVSLLKDIIQIKDCKFRVRISSIECTQISDEYIDLIANNQNIICPHFHMPLQSGSDRILKMMNRKYTIDYFQNTIDKIKSKIPSAALSADVICGFPSETEDDFKCSYNFLQDNLFMRIHAFPYSERPNTPAEKLEGVIDKRVRDDRVRELIKLSDVNSKKYRETLKGVEGEVLIESTCKSVDMYIGYTERYLRSTKKSDTNIIGNFYTCKY